MYGQGNQIISGVSSVGYAPAAAPPMSAPVSPSHIASALQDQERLILALHDELGSLEQRLTPTLRPTGPDESGQANAPTPVVSPFAQTLNENNAQFARAIMRVRSMSARADL